MAKEKVLQRDEITFLNQLVKSLEEAESSLENAKNTNDYEKFNKSKRMMLHIQKKISDILG